MDKENNYINYKIRVTKDEFEFLKNMEKISGIGRKEMILKSCKKQRGFFSNEQVYILKRELNSIGINLNQTVRQLNKNIKRDDRISIEDVENLRKDVEVVWQYLKSLNKKLEIMLK